MQEVTCFHCRTVVQIAPDDDHCANCGEDLRGLLAPEYVADYFGDRVAALAEAGRTDEALAEAERGLTYHDIAELRLVAAILAEELGRFDVMRAHVAAISVDDSLRAEAEWLLRAHQERQKALRAGAKHVRYGAQSAAAPSVLSDVLGLPTETVIPRRSGVRVWTAIAAALIVVILAITWTSSRSRTAGVATQSAAPGQTLGDTAEPSSAPAVPAADQADTRQDAAEAAQEPETVPLAAEPANVPPADSEAPAPLPTERLLPVPTPSVPQDLVLPATESEAIVDSNPRSVVVLSADGFDLARVLRENGYPELAELPVDARLQEGKLVLTGIVYLDLQRRQILEALGSVPGINEVSAVNLLLRPKQTYQVQPGDTLWTIVYDIYGDVERVEDFYLANIDLAPSPDAMRVGEELRVPPLE